MADPPTVIVLAGPNGAGKSTAAAWLLPKLFPFVNVDELAKTLPSYPSGAAAWEAGRISLEIMDDLEKKKESFAVETTLAGRTLAPRLQRLRGNGYQFRLLFIKSPSAEFSIARVAARVVAGGHNIPEQTIKRRFVAGITNFFFLYKPIADKWGVYDATGLAPGPIARGRFGGQDVVTDHPSWNHMKEIADYE